MNAGKTSKAAVAVLLPKQLRAEWVDVMALDTTLSNNAFRAACVIGSHFNKYTGDGYPGIITIAEKMGVSDRTAWSAVNELEASGYLIVKRRDLGTQIRKLKNGGETTVRLAGGKGVANTYQPAFERSQISATNGGVKLAERCDLYWSQSSQKSVPKVATDCDPTLTPSTKENPSRAREPSALDGLGSRAALLRQRLGDNVYVSWFRAAEIVDETPDGVTITFPTRFVRDQVRSRYDRELALCFEPKRVALIVVGQPIATGEDLRRDGRVAVSRQANAAFLERRP